MADERRWTIVCTDERGNEMVFMNTHYWFEDEVDARAMRTTLMLRECIVLRLKIGETRAFDPANLPHIEGWFNGRCLTMPIEAAIIGGPAFEEAAAAAQVAP